ncbi:MAG: hypothetical protein HQL01_08990 [Nitrospirae bacterium]|nr:hypothetical protein [Nitrospirota bacterium]
MIPLRHRNSLLKAAALFFISYFIILVIWIQVKEIYGTVLLSIISNVIGIFTHAAYIDVYREQDVFTVVFGSLKYRERAIPMSINAFTYNVPVTFAILSALLPFIKRKIRALLEVASFLVSIHIVYVVILEMLSFTIEANAILHAIIEYFFLFMHKIMTRSEPFIIGLYLWAIHVYRSSSDEIRKGMNMAHKSPKPPIAGFMP